MHENGPTAAHFDLAAYLENRRTWVNESLDAHLPPATEPPTTLHEAMRYSMFCGGKRLRPILVIAGAEVVSGDARLALPLACAVECIHTFSLIHDDLPAIDDDDLRRGMPTSHKVYGEDVAILAGDALLALSFELIALCGETLPPGPVLKAVSLIARASGTMGMVGGQVDDLAAEGNPGVDLTAVESIHARKTGALLSASLLAGAGLFEPPKDTLTRLRDYGDRLGLAFQITDDLLDLHGDEATIGKPVGSDVKHDKATYPKLLGVDASRRLADEAAEGAVTALDGLGPEADPLRALARYMVERES
jgi:geranylgeranyl diphosphate synthase type II